MISYTYEEPEPSSCACCLFHAGADLPVPRELDVITITLEARKLSTRILSNYEMLTTILDRCEEIIRKRWSNKSTKQRTTVILTANPNIPRVHRPDFEAIRISASRRKTFKLEEPRRSNTHLRPQINLEDMVKGNLLPLLLHSRGHNSPAVFVEQDRIDSRMGHGWMRCIELGQLSMSFHGKLTPEKYGRVTLRSKDSNTLIMFPQCPPILGLWTLEIQDGIYDFLTKCCLAILHDHTLDKIETMPSRPAMDVPEMSDRNHTFGPSTIQLALESPLRPPQIVDLERFKLLLNSRRSTAEEHIWSLREDPGYFVACVRDQREHDISLMTMEGIPQGEWGQAAGAVLSKAFRTFQMLDRACLALGGMRPMEVQMAEADKENGMLALEDAQAWSFFDLALDRLFEMPEEGLMRGIVIAPRMRALTTYSCSKGWHLKNYNKDIRTGLVRAHTLLATFLSRRDKTGLRNICEEIQNMLDNDPEAAALLDPWLIQEFSDFALFAEIRRSLELWQPWARAWCNIKDLGPTYGGNVEVIVQKLDVIVRSSERQWVTLCRAPCNANAGLGDPTDGRFDYPADARPSKKNTEQMISAENLLAQIWESVDANITTIDPKGLWARFISRSERQGPIWKTKEWEEPEHTPTKDNIKDSTNIQGVELPFRTPSSDTTSRRGGLELAVTRVKVKTRGQAEPDIEHEEEPEAADDLPQEHAVIKLATGPYRTMQIIFHSLEAMRHFGKEASWESFVVAMHAIGFRPTKLYGSVWIFAPERINLRRSIEFHEPKDVRRGSKIGHLMLRNFSRRLNRAYEWDADTFVLAEK